LWDEVSPESSITTETPLCQTGVAHDASRRRPFLPGARYRTLVQLLAADVSSFDVGRLFLRTVSVESARVEVQIGARVWGFGKEEPAT